METNNLTAYSYKANTSESYSTLVEYATAMIAAQKITLIPFELTIIVEPKNDTAISSIGSYIDQNGLDFHIATVEPAEENLTNIISEITEKLNIAEKSKADCQADADMYRKYWLDGSAEISRIKEQVNAIGVLLTSIFPKV